MYATASARGEVRVLGVALEVAARERMAVDVDRRCEQHVRALAARLVADPAPDLFDELRIPRRAERGAAREGGRRPPVHRSPRAPIGPSVTFSGGMPSRSTAAVCHRSTPATMRRLLVDGELGEHVGRSRSCTVASSQASRAVLPACRAWTVSTTRSRSSPAPAAGSAARSRTRSPPRARASSPPTSSRRRSSRRPPRPTRISTMLTDVTRYDDVVALADHAFATFGAGRRPLQQRGRVRGRAHLGAAASDFEWTLGVNLWGILHGIRAFVPRMLAAQRPAHIVNTVSMAGLCSTPFTAPYNVSKFAALAATECLAHDLAAVGAPISVSVLVPSAVATRIGDIRPQSARPRSPARRATTRPSSSRRSSTSRSGTVSRRTRSPR